MKHPNVTTITSFNIPLSKYLNLMEYPSKISPIMELPIAHMISSVVSNGCDCNLLDISIIRSILKANADIALKSKRYPIFIL